MLQRLPGIWVAVAQRKGDPTEACFYGTGRTYDEATEVLVETCKEFLDGMHEPGEDPPPTVAWAKHWLATNCDVMEPFELTHSMLAAHANRGECPYTEAFQGGRTSREDGEARHTNPHQRLANSWDAGWIFGKRGSK